MHSSSKVCAWPPVGFIHRKNEAIKVDYICYVYAIRISSEDSQLTRHSLSKISFEHPRFPPVLACLRALGLAAFEHLPCSTVKGSEAEARIYTLCFKSSCLGFLLCDHFFCKTKQQPSPQKVSLAKSHAWWTKAIVLLRLSHSKNLRFVMCLQRLYSKDSLCGVCIGGEKTLAYAERRPAAIDRSAMIHD